MNYNDCCNSNNWTYKSKSYHDMAVGLICIAGFGFIGFLMIL
ncbi:hypothetical protein [Clostridioides difficile]|nr:hypothetical protein [Clostridioides difficile]